MIKINVEKLIGFLIIMFNIYSYGNDCITFKNNEKICCTLKFETNNYFLKNYIYLYDTLKIGLNDIKEIVIGEKKLYRVSEGNKLSNFAELTFDGNIKFYEKKEHFQLGNRSFYNVKSKYFSIGNDSLYYYSLKYLLKYFPSNNSARNYLENANVKKWISIGIRTCSVVPFYLGINSAVSNKNNLHWLPLGVGISMLVVPSFTLSVAIKEDINMATFKFNEMKKQ